MTLTTTIRIDYPVPAAALLDHVTRIAGGDPSTIQRREHKPGDRMWEGSDERYDDYGIANRAGQGLQTLAWVVWAENRDTGEADWPCPPSLVRLSLDNPYGFGHEDRGRWVQANLILPAVVEWLDAQGVPRDRWWWEDETAGTWHPGTEDVAKLDSPADRETWAA